ncbi:hypothetical protein BGX23_005018, partial [Mortierella sp. AD031]
MYDVCKGVPQNYSQAIEWYLRAANRGNTTAQYHLGRMYHHGKGVPQDYSKAMEWYLKAADQGNAVARVLKS